MGDYSLEQVLWPDLPFEKERLILIARRGSDAHNTYVPRADPNSVDDRDIYCVAIPHREYYLGTKTFQHAEAIKTDEAGEVWDVVVDELKKFIGMIAKSNPNVFGMLWLREEDYLHVSPLARHLINNRGMFVSRRFGFDAFAGYARGQFKKMLPGAYNGVMGDKRKGLVDKYGYDCKNAAHCIRLLHMGEEYMKDGILNVWRTWDRDMLVDIKTGGWPLTKVHEYAEKKFADIQTAYDNSKIQETPSLGAINTMLSMQLWDYLKANP